MATAAWPLAWLGWRISGAAGASGGLIGNTFALFWRREPPISLNRDVKISIPPVFIDLSEPARLSMRPEAERLGARARFLFAPS